MKKKDRRKRRKGTVAKLEVAAGIDHEVEAGIEGGDQGPEVGAEGIVNT